MQLYQILALCLAIATMAVALELHFKDCGSEGAKVESLDVSPCESDPCTLHRGTNYTTKIVFTPLINSTTVTNELVISAFGRKKILPLPKPACEYFKCPFVEGEQQTGKVEINIDPRIPKIGLQLKWTMYGDDKKKLFCLSLHYRINRNM